MDDVIFIQTADPFGYKDMLDQTSRTVVEYCRRHDFGYESFVGIKRGFYAWHATFNRIPILQEMVERGYRGWVVYLDADAYVYQLDFDLRSYLSERAHHAAVMTPIPGQDVLWNINAGVFIVNLGHPLGRELVALWHARFMQLGDADLKALVDWPEDVNDQAFLAQVLGDSVGLRESVYYESAELLNSCYGQFIRQLLRAHYPSQAVRTQAIRNAIDEVVPSAGNFTDRAYPVLMSALFRAVLRRDPLPGELEELRPRFGRLGIEKAFHDTLHEMIARRPPEPVPARARVRAAYRWILGEEAADEDLDRYESMLNNGSLDVPGLRDILMQQVKPSAPSSDAPPRTGLFRYTSR